MAFINYKGAQIFDEEPSSEADAAVAWQANAQLLGDLNERAPIAGLHGPTIHGTPIIIRNTTDLSSGDNELYTVPEGHFLLVLNRGIKNTNIGSSVNFNDTVTIDSTVIRLQTSNTTVSTGSFSLTDRYHLLDAGEILGCNASAADGIVTYRCLLIDKDELPQLKRVSVINLQKASNEYYPLYTCPADTVAWTLNNEFAFHASPSNNNGAGGYVINTTGGNIIGLVSAVVPNGQSNQTDWLTCASVTINNNASNVAMFGGCAMNAGDVLKLGGAAISAAGFHVFIPIWEMSV